MQSRKALVISAWERIEAWIEANDKTGKLILPPGAAADEITRAEVEMGIKLPQDVRASYTRHNGRYGLWLFEQGYLMPLTAESVSKLKQYNVVRLWTDMQKYALAMKGEPGSEPKGPIKKDWWNKRWIPLIDNECGDNICLDMTPAAGGHIGQVIDWWHEKGATAVLAENFAKFLTRHADNLENGKYRINEAGQIALLDEPG